MDITVLISMLTGGAFLAFLQFLIQRHDTKKEKNDDVKEALGKLDERLTAIEDDLALERATTARVRILRCSDEITRGIRHSKEYFDQTLDDINVYNHHCDSHPDFKNSKAVLAIRNIERVYENCLQENDFL